MSFVDHPFSGDLFFADIRDRLTDRGAFAGKDGTFRYFVMDSRFYRLGVLLRDADKAFTDAALDEYIVDSSLRVVTNASFIADYGWARVPGNIAPPSWEGELVIEHQVRTGDPPTRPRHRHVGQWDGQTGAAFQFERGDPSSVDPSFNHAIGGLLPILKRGVPFGPKEVRDSSTGALLVAPSGDLATMMLRGDGTGWIICGLHRAMDLLFVLLQKHEYTFLAAGKSLQEIIDILVSMGVNDAVLGDGSDSVTMALDGALEVAPVYYKDNSMGAGFTFSLLRWHLGLGGRLVSERQSTDPAFEEGFRIEFQRGMFSAEAAGLEVTITSLGTTPQHTHDEITALLGATRPLVLKRTAAQDDGTEKYAGGNAVATLQFVSDTTPGALLTGRITFTTRRGDAVFDVHWPLEL